MAHLVWQALGNCKHYIEPFFGSGAVLLARPGHKPSEQIEDVCDKDGLLCNVWRGLKYAPNDVAEWCDWPVDHAELCARRIVLLREQEALLSKLIADETYFDAKLAGFWVWAASCWIGSGLTCMNAIPHISDGGMGVHAIGQRPHISDGGRGVHAMGQIPHISHGGRGEPFNGNIYRHFRQLQERLRYVRVVCGDWTRVCGGDWQDKEGTCGMFFDPPYSDKAGRAKDIYAEDSLSVAHGVREWCKKRGSRPGCRIVLAGYYEEHVELLEHGWRVTRWKANGGYSDPTKNDNRKKEALFFSPHCLDGQRSLF